MESVHAVVWLALPVSALRCMPPAQSIRRKRLPLQHTNTPSCETRLALDCHCDSGVNNRYRSEGVGYAYTGTPSFLPVRPTTMNVYTV